MLVLVAAAFLARKFRKHLPQLWWALAAWSVGIMLLMCPFTLFFWEHLPKLQFIQLPWRWMLCFNVAVIMFIAMGTRRIISRLVIVLGLAAVLLLVWHRIQPPWWETAEDIAEMRDDFIHGRGYEGTDEYVPAGADPYEIKQDAPRVAWHGSGKMHVQEKLWKPECKEFTVAVSGPGSLVLRLFNFPAWNVRVNGHLVATQTTEESGQMIIPVSAGKDDIRIALSRTWDRKLGAAITAIAFVLALLLLWTEKRSFRLHRTL
jgi:hypothetical protein